MLALAKKFSRDESGATAIEYGLIAALVSMAAIGAMRGLGESLSNLFTSVSGEISNAVNSAG
jgi:pilus assembly protein Flp/PilA